MIVGDYSNLISYTGGLVAKRSRHKAHACRLLPAWLASTRNVTVHFVAAVTAVAAGTNTQKRDFSSRLREIRNIIVYWWLMLRLRRDHRACYVIDGTSAYRAATAQ